MTISLLTLKISLYIKIFLNSLKDLISFKSFVGGKWIDDPKEGNLDILDKYDQTVLASIPFLNASQIEQAVKTSEDAFKIMSQWSAGQRALKLEKLYELLNEKKELCT
mgnify:CR=1 FL=1